jgi:hypothetical protein
VAADTAYVRVDGDNGSANPLQHGSAWGSAAYKYLQDALAWAEDLVQQPEWDDAEVWVAATDEWPYRPDLGANQQQGPRHAGLHVTCVTGAEQGSRLRSAHRRVCLS